MAGASNYIMLSCTECKNKNYRTTKNKKLDRLELKKYCPCCKKHTIHKEDK